MKVLFPAGIALVCNGRMHPAAAAAAIAAIAPRYSEPAMDGSRIQSDCGGRLSRQYHNRVRWDL